MDIVNIVKKSAYLKELMYQKTFDLIFERYPVDTDFKAVLDECGLGSSTFSDLGYIANEQYASQSDSDLVIIINKEMDGLEEILRASFDLFFIIHCLDKKK